uniref:Uncharacterized protein n=1 Tax=Arundo donax TaxID=35708 RepID=A0A0A9BPF6_ARUDO
MYLWHMKKNGISTYVQILYRTS